MISIWHFRNATEKEKTESLARLVKLATGDFDFYLFVSLSIVIATIGLIADSPEVIIGSMLIAPVLYPILSLSLSLVLADLRLAYRSLRTLGISFLVVVGVAWGIAGMVVLFGNVVPGMQLLARAEPSILYFIVAFCSGFAATYALVHANLSEALPGVAISVSLVPPLASVGVGLALMDLQLALGAFSLFFLNVAGIVLASMIVLTIMSVHGAHKVVQSAVLQEDRRITREKEMIQKNHDAQSLHT
jgi:uncharacterized hydrophobic protein (TIGR00271 family)